MVHVLVVKRTAPGIDDMIVTGTMAKYGLPIFAPHNMNWTLLTELEQLDTIDRISHGRPVLIFKHSTRCSISSAALGRLERAWTAENDALGTSYFLDLIRHRALSDAIAERYNIVHESPQVLIIRDGKCVDVAAHFGITYADTVAALHG
jgi:bacillithiol system protein YtxJ